MPRVAREREHEIQDVEHPDLGEYIDRAQANGGYLDVLSAVTIARREDSLAEQTSAERKREIYTNVHSATPDTHPVHLCLAADHERGRMTGVAFDTDSIMGFVQARQWQILECGRT